MTISYNPPKRKTAYAAAQIPTERRNIDSHELSSPPSIVQANIPLAGLTSFRVGGPAQWYAAPRCEADLLASLAWAKAQEIPVTVIGAGSNLLVSDEGLPGLVIATRNMRQVDYQAQTGQVIADAGVHMAQLARQVAKRGWSGLEWAIGIPGTVGGAVVMNAGAHQSCMADSLIDIQTLTNSGVRQTFTREQLNYGYRTSILQGTHYTVTQARFQLEATGNPEQVMETTNTHLHQRHSTQPYYLPSCGSVFRNPEPQKSARLIEATGLKGHKIGDAQVSELHANFILNCGSATATDIFRLIRYVQEKVEQQHSVRLHPEVKILGRFEV